MVLDALDDGAQRLVLVLCLPLVDGVFATLLVGGAVATFSDALAVAVTVFSGAGAIAVLYAESESVTEARRLVFQAVPFLLVGASLVGLVAPVFEQLFYVERIRYAAGLALLVIAGQLVDVDLADRFTVPGIILTGALLSLREPGAFTMTSTYLLPAVGTAALAVVLLLGAASVRTDMLSLRSLRRGSAVVLLVIALSLFGMDVPSEVGLAVFAATIMASVNR